MIYELIKENEKQLTRIITLKKGEVLFHEDDICEEIGIVVSGVISISSYSYQGIEMNYNTILKGGIFGNNLIFSSEPYHKGNITAKLESTIMLINKKNLLYLLQNNENFLLAYLNIQSDFGKSLNNKIKTLSFNHAKDRLLYYLASHNNEIKYRSVSALASELNLSREVLSRLLTKLVKEKVIVRNNNKIIYIAN